MGLGVIGQSGVYVHARVVAVFQCKVANVTIHDQKTKVHSVLANAFDTKHATWINVQKVNPVFVHSNAHNSTTRRIEKRNTIGCRTSIVVSEDD